MRLQQQYSKVSVGRLCNLFGRTRHAFYDKLWRDRSKMYSFYSKSKNMYNHFSKLLLPV
jgi:hypothetical protein